MDRSTHFIGTAEVSAVDRVKTVVNLPVILHAIIVGIWITWIGGCIKSIYLRVEVVIRYDERNRPNSRIPTEGVQPVTEVYNMELLFKGQHRNICSWICQHQHRELGVLNDDDRPLKKLKVGVPVEAVSWRIHGNSE